MAEHATILGISGIQDNLNDIPDEQKQELTARGGRSVALLFPHPRSNGIQPPEVRRPAGGCRVAWFGKIVATLTAKHGYIRTQLNLWPST